jgi:hypothetical protein
MASVFLLKFSYFLQASCVTFSDSLLVNNSEYHRIKAVDEIPMGKILSYSRKID